MSSEYCYGVLGWPLGHSASPALMGRIFAERHLAFTYRLLEYPLYPGIEVLAHEHPHLMGFNVTLPYKIKVYEEIVCKSAKNTAWSLSEEATACEAVNCVRLLRDSSGQFNRVIGHNTDAQGFAAALSILTQNRIQGPALIMGNGGASKAVRFACNQRKVLCTTLCRTLPTGYHNNPERSHRIWEEADATLISRNPLIIQCTPVGMWPKISAVPPLPPQAMEGIGPHHRVMDLIYRPERTLFLDQCAERGAQVLGGWAMLEEQAIASVDFWLA